MFTCGGATSNAWLKRNRSIPLLEKRGPLGTVRYLQLELVRCDLLTSKYLSEKFMPSKSSRNVNSFLVVQHFVDCSGFPESSLEYLRVWPLHFVDRKVVYAPLSLARYARPP